MGNDNTLDARRSTLDARGHTCGKRSATTEIGVVRRASRVVPVFAILLLAPGAARAQQASTAGNFRPVDRIVAVVGGKPILLSRVQEEFNVYRAQGGKVPGDTVAFLREIVNRLVNDELVVQAAQKDTAIQISLKEVEASVDEAFKNVREQFPSDLEFQRQLRTAGFGTPEEYRQWVYDQKRRETLTKQYMNKLRQKGLIKPIPATEAEAKEYYEKNKGSLPHRPATVT